MIDLNNNQARNVGSAMGVIGAGSAAQMVLAAHPTLGLCTVVAAFVLGLALITTQLHWDEQGRRRQDDLVLEAVRLGRSVTTRTLMIGAAVDDRSPPVEEPRGLPSAPNDGSRRSSP